MSTKRSDPNVMASEFLGHLRKLRDDRGAMADLRRALTPAQRHRAWPLLARFGGIDNPRYETVAGLFACHPDDDARAGNLGATCRKLSADHNTFEGRLKRMLACDRDEICDHIRPVVLVAKTKGVRINYERLFVDLHYWSPRVKADWAAEFWGSSESAGAMSPADAEVTS